MNNVQHSNGEIKKQRALVVVFDPVLASMVGRVLKQNDFEVSYAHDGIEGPRIADEIKPDVLVTDIVIPGPSGVDLAIYVHANHPECKILMFTWSSKNEEMVKYALKMGHEFDFMVFSPIEEENLKLDLSAWLHK